MPAGHLLRQIKTSYSMVLHTTGRYFGSCELHIQALKGQGKIQAMSKIASRVTPCICTLIKHAVSTNQSVRYIENFVIKIITPMIVLPLPVKKVLDVLIPHLHWLFLTTLMVSIQYNRNSIAI